MTIIVEGQTLSRLPASVDDLFKQFPSLQKDATKLVNRPIQRIESSTEKVLYVTQKEYAIVKTNDEQINLVGSDDATTCHILILENPAESVLCLAHIDTANNLESLAKMVRDVVGNSNICSTVFELSLYGGYIDERMLSENLTLDLLAFYHQLPVKIRLKAACVGPANTAFRDGINWPIFYGIAVNLQSNLSITPATFDLNVRGPCIALRSARLFCNKESLYRVYHSNEGKLRIDPFEYPVPHRITKWIHMSDDYVRTHFSTSPAVEPTHFSQEMKQVFQFVAQNPFPMHSVFKSQKPIEFHLSPSTGQWCSV